MEGMKRCPTEAVHVKLKGICKEAPVCTDKRIMILKPGYMTGHFFGMSVFQMAYRNITDAKINTHVITGYVEVSGSGVQNEPASDWASNSSSPQRRDNCVSLTRGLFSKYQRAAGS